MQEKQGHIKLGVEGEAEALLIHLQMRDREVHLRVDADGVIGGTDRLDESVLRGRTGVGVGRDGARYDGKPHIRIGCGRRDLKRTREKKNIYPSNAWIHDYF